MPNKLSRSLTLTQLSFYGIGTIIGAGIYSVIGVAAGEAGSGLLISFLLAGIAAFVTVFSYAELASMFPKAGAEYQYLKNALPRFPIVSFLAGYLIAVNSSATAATVALAFAGYLNVFITLPIIPMAFGLLAMCTIINILGIRQTTWVGIILICIEVSGLLIMIAAGFAREEIPLKTLLAIPEAGALPGIFAATSIIFFMYIGFEDVANLSEEAKEPQRNIPMALLISVSITTIIYLLLAFAVLSVISPEQLATSTSPLTDAGNKIAPWVGTVLAITALFATASTALITLVSISRMLFGMGREGDMPKILSRTLPKRHTPWVAALTLFVTACLLLPLGEVKITASISAFVLLLVFMTIQAAVIILRYRKPDLKRPFKMPLSMGKLPLIPVLGIIIIAALITQFETVVYIIGISSIAFGMIIFFLIKKNKYLT